MDANDIFSGVQRRNIDSTACDNQRTIDGLTDEVTTLELNS